MIYNPYPEINLPFGNDNKYFKWLFDAISQVSKDFFTYSFKEQKYDYAVGNKSPTLCHKCRNSIICETCGRSFPYPKEQREEDQKAGKRPPRECKKCMNTKPCPVCGEVRVPKYFDYCDNCKDKTAEYRECKNCYERFPVSYKQIYWEKKQAKRIYTKCQTCYKSRCSTTPCIHAKSRQAETRSQQQAQPAKTGGGGCYIATAVYGSYTHPQTMVLRAYRDNVLLEHPGGRAFVRVYYATSPTLVKLFGNCAWFNHFWRKRLDAMVEQIKAKYGY